MRTVRVVVPLLIAVTTLSTSPSARAETTARCDLKRAKVIEHAGPVRVLRTTSGKVYSCFSPTGKRKLLADVGENLSGNGTAIRRIVLVGRYVAYARHEYLDGTDASYFVDVVDARRGTRTTAAAGPIETLRHDVADPVTRVRLAANGAVAWIYQNPFTEPVRFEVHQALGGADELLAAGPAIDPTLLIVSDGLVIWRADGRLQSAPAYPQRRGS